MDQSIVKDMSLGNVNDLGHTCQSPEEIAVKNAVAVPTECRSVSSEVFAFVIATISQNCSHSAQPKEERLGSLYIIGRSSSTLACSVVTHTRVVKQFSTRVLPGRSTGS